MSTMQEDARAIRARYQEGDNDRRSPQEMAESVDPLASVACLLRVRTLIEDHHDDPCRFPRGGTCSCWVSPAIADIDEALIPSEPDEDWDEDLDDLEDTPA